MPLIYYTIEELLGHIDKARLIELTNDGASDEVGQETLELVNASVATYIDSYFFNDYELPFNPVPKVIKDLACKATVVTLWERRDAATVPDSIVLMKRGIERELARLAEVGIQGATPKSNQAISQSHSNKTAEDRVFTNDLLKTFRQFPL